MKCDRWRKTILLIFALADAASCLLLADVSSAADQKPISIGQRRELFVDRELIDRLQNARLELARPQPGGTAVSYDKPWEGPFAFYTTVFRDGDKFRMYYRGAANVPGFRYTVCYAESADGIVWRKPELGIVEIDGSKANNVLLFENQCLVPFLDDNPQAPADERYKANAFVETRFGDAATGLKGYVSADGLHWRVCEQPLLLAATLKNNFDSQNVIFWSEVEQQYVLFARHSDAGVRAQSRATSKDFKSWSQQTMMTYSDTGSTVPSAQLYTSQVQPYFRAPHVYISMPGRLMQGRRVLSEKQAERLEIDARGGGAGDCADGVLQVTRAGSTKFDRTFQEALVRPGLGDGNWVSRTNYPACGIVQTGPAEMSIYVQRHYGQKTAYLERLTLRLDGFASIRAPLSGGELLTRPLVFSGSKLELNCATSAAGGLRVALENEQGEPLPGFTMADCDEIIGDELARIVTWRGKQDVSALSGQAVRLRFELRDADLYSLRFSSE